MKVCNNLENKLLWILISLSKLLMNYNILLIMFIPISTSLMKYITYYEYLFHFLYYQWIMIFINNIYSNFYIIIYYIFYYTIIKYLYYYFLILLQQILY